MGEDILRELGRLIQQNISLESLGYRSLTSRTGNVLFQSIGATGIVRFVSELDVAARIREELAPKLISDTASGVRSVMSYAPRIPEDIAVEGANQQASHFRIFIHRPEGRQLEQGESDEEWQSTKTLPYSSEAEVFRLVESMTNGSELEVRINYYRPTGR